MSVGIEDDLVMLGEVYFDNRLCLARIERLLRLRAQYAGDGARLARIRSCRNALMGRMGRNFEKVGVLARKGGEA